jgi:hypothetical protein
VASKYGAIMQDTIFKQGDLRSLKAIRGLVQAVTGKETFSEELDLLNRLIEVARKFEDDTY